MGAVSQMRELVACSLRGNWWQEVEGYEKGEEPRRASKQEEKEETRLGATWRKGRNQRKKSSLVLLYLLLPVFFFRCCCLCILSILGTCWAYSAPASASASTVIEMINFYQSKNLYGEIQNPTLVFEERKHWLPISLSVQLRWPVLVSLGDLLSFLQPKKDSILLISTLPVPSFTPFSWFQTLLSSAEEAVTIQVMSRRVSETMKQGLRERGNFVRERVE